MAVGDASALIAAMAASDCEAVRDGWLAQPVNAWSSSAYLLAGGYLVVRHRELVGRARAIAPAVLTLAAVAIGSILYHGPQPAWGDAVHDAAITLLLGALSGLGAAKGSVRDRHRRALAVVVVAAVVLVVAVPSSVAAVHGALAGLVAITSARTMGRDGIAQAGRLALVALAAGIVLFTAGRTGGPLCEPRSLVQPHAGWHVATAIAAAALVSGGVTSAAGGGSHTRVARAEPSAGRGCLDRRGHRRWHHRIPPRWH